MLDYDCVTVPGLGGFILQSKPAWINRGKNRIYPPSRLISFNSLLNHDDGLLISSIAKAREVSYREAGSVVAEFTEVCKRKIASGEAIVMEGIGELIPGQEGRLEFRQSGNESFNNKVFGMASISLYTKEKTPGTTRLDQKPVDRKIKRQKERKPASVKWTLAVSVPVILFLLYGIIFPQSIQQIYTQYSGFLFLYNRIENKTEIPSTPVSTITVPAPVVITEQVRQEVPEVTRSEVAKAEVTKAEVMAGPKYYIIGGCFESGENADKFYSELTRRGFEAEKAGTTSRGHFRISYKSFTEKAPALSYLQEIRARENPSAWLLKY
jgi:hypothetical protein